MVLVLTGKALFLELVFPICPPPETCYKGAERKGGNPVCRAALCEDEAVERGQITGMLLKDGRRRSMNRTFCSDFQSVIVRRLNG